MDDEPGVARIGSGVSLGAASDADAAAAVVSESLQGLLSAVDELKKSMGMGEQVDLSAVESFVKRLQEENQEFRQFAEEAIRSAQRLRDERDELQSRLDQVALEATMSSALAETQKLKDVAEEFEKDLYEKKLAEAEARAAEADGLRDRIAELEEENAGLTQTLNEFRATTQQLQKLQSHEVRRLQAAEAAGLAGAAAAATTGSLEADQLLQQQPPQNGTGTGPPLSTASAGSSPRAAFGGAGGTSRSRTPGHSPRGAPLAAAAAAAPAGQSPQAAAAARIAEQLEEVVGGSDSGLLAEAAVALRQLSQRDGTLQAVEQENARLKAEVAELNDTMFSKTFKAPSAWAEREIKYKTEKKYWEEQHKELAARLAALSLEMEGYRGASKADQLEDRIQELEAALVQSQREKDAARAQLHELQLSLRTEGEFGEGGKRLSPYKALLGVSSDGREVHHVVEHMEHARVAIQSPEAVGLAASADRLRGLQSQLAQAATENQHLRRRLQEQHMVAVPPSLQAELGQVASGAAVLATAADLEARLQRAEAEGQVLRQQQQQGGEAPAAGSASAVGVAQQAEQQVRQLEARAAQAEAAGDQEEAAALRQQVARLQQLGQQLRAAEEDRVALQAQLAELAPIRLQIAAAAAGDAAGDAAAGEDVAVPKALQAELGATAPAAAIAAKAAEIERQLRYAEQDAEDLQRHLQHVVHLEDEIQAAAAEQQQVEGKLAAAESGGDAASEELVEQLRQHLSAAQHRKEEAQVALWQLADLQEQLEKAEAIRRRLQGQLTSAEEAAARGGAGEEEHAEVAQLRAEVAAAREHSEDIRSELHALLPAEPIGLSLRIAGDEGSSEEAAARLAAVDAEAARLRQQLADLQPLRLELSLAEEGPDPASVAGGNDASPTRLYAASSAATSPQLLPPASPGDLLLGAEHSDVSLASVLQYSTDQAAALSKERAEAEAAWREHQKASDVPALLRAKAELETKVEMLEAQLAKMQGELAHADEANAVMEEEVESVLESGDVSRLSDLKSKLASGRASLSRRFLKRQGSKSSPSKDVLKTTVHEMQDALTTSEEEKNALKRQLAKLSKKYQQLTMQQAHTAGIIAGAAALAAEMDAGKADSDSAEVAAAPAANGQRDEDSELELFKLREENQMLMEHVVMVKVRQAEMEGEYLEAKRQLLRMREKSMQLAKKLQDCREAAEKGEPLPLTPRSRKATTSAGQEVAAAPAPTPKSERKSLLRIPGL